MPYQFGQYTPAQSFYQPQMQQQLFVPPIQQAPQSPAVRLVTSREEAAAHQIAFDGSTTYFVDTSNGKIYAKTFDPSTGTAPIVSYVREQEPKIQYATLEDINMLKAEIENLKKGGGEG